MILSNPVYLLAQYDSLRDLFSALNSSKKTGFLEDKLVAKRYIECITSHAQLFTRAPADRLTKSAII
jgi:hypothetical protein